MHVLGIDAGGTKTVALLADGDGRIVADGRAGGANLQTEGELQVEKVLHDVIEQVTRGRNITPAAVCLGMAGVDREADGRTIRDIMRRLGYRSNTLIVNDALIALVAGAGASPGLVVISGTGSIAFGVSHRGLAARAGGWGPTLGDEGSGYWIGRRALEAVTRDADGRGPRTELTQLVLDHFQLPRPQSLVVGDLPSAAGPPRDRRARAARRRRACRWRSGGRRDHDRGRRRAGQGGRVGDLAARDARRTVSDPARRRYAETKRVARGRSRAPHGRSGAAQRSACRSRTNPRSARCGWPSLKPRGGVRVPPYIDAVRATPQ